MKERQSVEIAYLINGDVISVRRLSQRGEWRAALDSVRLGRRACRSPERLWCRWRCWPPIVWCTCRRMSRCGRWSGSASRRWSPAAPCAGHAATASVRASTTTRSRYRRCRWCGGRGGGYRLALVPGFSGRIENGRAPIPVESLVAQGPADVPFASDGRAELRIGTGTFVVRGLPDDGPVPRLPAGVVRRFVRRSALPLEMAALASVLCAVPVGAQIGEADMKSAIPAHATPLGNRKASAVGSPDAGARPASVFRRAADRLPAPGLRRGRVVAVAGGRDSVALDCPLDVRRGLPRQPMYVERDLELVLRAVAGTDEGHPAGPGAADRQTAAVRRRAGRRPIRSAAWRARRRSRRRAPGLTECRKTNRPGRTARQRARTARGQPHVPDGFFAVGDRAERRRRCRRRWWRRPSAGGAPAHRPATAVGAGQIRQPSTERPVRDRRGRAGAVRASARRRGRDHGPCDGSAVDAATPSARQRRERSTGPGIRPRPGRGARRSSRAPDRRGRRHVLRRPAP